MKKRVFIPAKGVSNIELFYDLLFVYCISVITSLLRRTQVGFPGPREFLTYTFTFITVLQIWFHTTVLMNRYGDGKAADNVCLFVNMFLMYFLAGSIKFDWGAAVRGYSVPWALILANLLIHWGIKLRKYSNLDEDDVGIIKRTMAVLGLQLVIVVIAVLLPPDKGVIASWVAWFFGLLIWAFSKAYHRKSPRFEHLTERCALLVIVMFGETLVTIATYLKETSGVLYPMLVFALTVGLFLIYIFEHDNMIDHHNSKTDGMVFLALTAWLVFVLGNITVAFGFMPREEISFVPKSIYVTAFLVLYLLTSFLLGHYNKPEFHYSLPFALGRLGACVAIVLLAVVSGLNPLICLVGEIVVVYAALWHEWYLYHARSELVSLGRALGYDSEMLRSAGYTFQTHDGRRRIAEALSKATREAFERMQATAGQEPDSGEKNTAGGEDDAAEGNGAAE